MIKQEIIDMAEGNGAFDEIVLENISHYTLDDDIDEGYEAGESITRDALLFRDIDHLADID